MSDQLKEEESESSLETQTNPTMEQELKSKTVHGLFSGLTDTPPDDLLATEEANENHSSTENPDQEMEVDVKIVPEISAQVEEPEVSVKEEEVEEEKIEMKEENIDSPVLQELCPNKDEPEITTKEKKSTPKPKKPVEKTPEVQSSVRRSSRANKGIGKEIFDPSYIPKSKMPSLEPPKRISSPGLSDSSSPSSGKGQSKISKEATDVSSDNASFQSTKSTPVRRPSSSHDADFSDEEDNIPLTKLKQEEPEKDEDFDEEQEESDESISDDADDSDDSYNNPDRLWCICHKPHDNRFMISCDKCEEWYHGDCVGITLQRGKKMEENGEEYVCPKCIKKEKKQMKSKLATPTKRKLSLEATKKPKKSLENKNLKSFALKGEIQKTKQDDRKNMKFSVEKNSEQSSKAPSSGRKCIVSSCINPALPGSVYCSNQCILRHAKESLKSLAKDQGTSKQKIIKKDNNPAQNKDKKDQVPVHCRKTGRILSGSNAPFRRDLAEFLTKNPSYEVFRPKSNLTPNLDKTPVKSNQEEEGISKSVSSLDFYRHVQNQNRKRDRYGTDPDYAPPLKKPSDGGAPGNGPNILEKKHKTASNVVRVNSYQPVKPSKAIPQTKDISENIRKFESSQGKSDASKVIRRKSSDPSVTSLGRKSSTEDRPLHGRIERSSSKSSSSASSFQGSSSDIRQNIKKSLLEILSKRSESSDDLKMHKDSIARLVTKIEDSLFKLFGDTNTKYKNKYRSIMFNLKDSRNPGLWRKVIIGDVSTSELVQMTAEQMASKKLAEWRQMELTHELDIIEKQEKEEANIRPVAKMTHKGEVVIQEDLSDLTATCFESRETSKAPLIIPARKKKLSISEDEIFDPSFLSSPDDTTLLHREHLFDLNCKICTGKVKEEDVEFPEETSKKIKSSSSIILSTEAQKSSSSSTPPSTPIIQQDPELQTKPLKIESTKKPLKEKDNRKMSDSRSHDPSLSPSSFLQKIASKSPSGAEKTIKPKPILPTPPPLSEVAPRVEEDEKTPPDQEEKDEDPPEAETPPEEEEEEVKKDSPPGPPVMREEKKIKRPQLIWSGSITMLELSTFKVNVYPVTGNCENLDIDLPLKLVLGGRIHPKVVWDYLLKVKALPTKQLSVVRFHASSDDDRVGYVAMLSYFSSRKRFGVVSNQDRMLVKDMYLIPLLESQDIPEQLMRTQEEDIEDSLPPHRPSMLLGIIVRHAPKPEHPPSTETSIQSRQPKPVEAPPKPPSGRRQVPIVEKVPPQQEKKVSLPLTEEEVGSNSSSKSSGSLLERNKSLAPSLRFFMRKATEENQSIKEQEERGDKAFSPSSNIQADEEDKDEDVDDGGDYDPADEIGGTDANDDEPYDPEQEEEYDPETAFDEKEEDVPYDPEQDEEMLKKQSNNEVNQLVEKQAYLEKMQRELEEKKAKLAEVEQNLQKTSSVKEQRVDPRIARRAAAQKPEEPPAPVSSTTSQQPPSNPLQTILSVLNMSSGSSHSSIHQREPSPPPLPDSTTKSDVEEQLDPPVEQKEEKMSGLVSYASTPDSVRDDVVADDVKRKESEARERNKKKEERHRRSRSSSSTSSRDSGHRRRRRDSQGYHDDRRHRKRSRSPRRHRHGSPRHHHHRHRDDRRSWSRDRRR